MPCDMIQILACPERAEFMRGTHRVPSIDHDEEKALKGRSLNSRTSAIMFLSKCINYRGQ